MFDCACQLFDVLSLGEETLTTTHAVGIDLGTTQSVLATVTSEGDTRVLQNSEGDSLTPSIVLFHDGKAVVGKLARAAASKFPDCVAECAKRDMGQVSYSRKVGDRHFPPEVLQGFVLRKLRHDLLANVGEDYQAIVTVPAYFDEVRRQRTVDAAVMSDIKVLDIVNEPTAAALAFGQELGYLGTQGEVQSKTTVLVYDLGGGTFDATIVQLEGLKITTLATDGDARLGGYDWDMRLVEYAKKIISERYPNIAPLDTAFEFTLRHSVERVKHALSESAEAIVSITLEQQTIEITFSRRHFEEMTADLLERTAFTTRQTLQAANLIWSDIDRILLVGGSTRMPMVRQKLSEMSGLIPDESIHPDEAVARGAALFAYTKLKKSGVDLISSGLKITDVVSHSLGIEGIDQSTLRKENVSLIKRNCALPFEVQREFVTKQDDQRNVLVKLLEGESRVPEHCRELGRARIRNLPRGLPKGTKVNVVYRLDSSGRLSVNAHMPGIGSEATIELQRDKSISKRGIEDWKNLICRDGGHLQFDDIDQIIESALNDFEYSEEAPGQKETQPDSKKKVPINLEPAIPEGAPLAAAESLQRTIANHQDAESSFSSEREFLRQRERTRITIRIIGHIVFSLLGIAGGIVALAFLRPSFREMLPEWLQGFLDSF